MQHKVSNRKSHILMVEDDKDQAFVLRYFLKNSGYKVDWCSTPQSCIKNAKNTTYDLILLDIMLNSEKDGFDICAQLKQDPALHHIPIIMVTARNQLQDKLDGFDLGADDYVTKPFNREELASRIKAVLKRKIYLDLAARYRELIENNTDIVLFLNNQGQIEHANKRAESVLPHLVGTNHQLDLEELFEISYSSRISSALYQSMAGNDVKLEKLRLKDTGENTVVVDTQLIPLWSGDRIIGIGCILRDTSAHEKVFKKMEKDTKLLKEKLETQNSELNEIQEKLVLSEKLAVMGQLAAGVAHEFRNPLNNIHLSVQAIRKMIRSPSLKVTEHFDIVDAEVKRATRIINNLLDFAKKSPAAKTKTPLNEIVDQILRLVQKELEINDIKVEFNRADNPVCFVNQDDIKQSILNIILNAKDAMPEGGKLTIKTSMKNSDYAQLDISDTGCGIPEKIREKIFEPFYTHTDKDGMGIGLSLVQSAIHRNNGQIEVTSKVDTGTTFRLQLPISQPNDQSQYII